MQDRLQIWGAGMAGLIAANVLRKHNPIVYEAKSELPHNHKALLRFRTDKVSIATGIPFKKVSIRKAIWYDGKLYNESNLKFDNLYSQKVTGTVAKRSIENFHGEVRYIAPHDFVERLAEGVEIEYNHKVEKPSSSAAISTLPMPLNMKIAGLNAGTKYECKEICSVNFYINEPLVDVYQTIYDVSEKTPFYRLSISGNKAIFEGRKEAIDAMFEKGAESAYIATTLREYFGIDTRNAEFTNPVKIVQPLGKIIPIDDTIRKNNILNLSRERQIYSLGRFATWRQIMLDDVIGDIDVIEKIMKQDNYNKTLYMCNK
mgnify:FL=1|jgi:hypothetical protein